MATLKIFSNTASDGIHVNDIMLSALDGYNGMSYEIQLNYIKLK